MRCRFCRAEGVKAELAFAKDGTVPDPKSTTNPEFQIVLAIIADSLKTDPQHWTKVRMGGLVPLARTVCVQRWPAHVPEHSAGCAMGCWAMQRRVLARKAVGQ